MIWAHGDDDSKKGLVKQIAWVMEKRPRPPSATVRGKPNRSQTTRLNRHAAFLHF
jgi:hypothetical protein